MKIKVVILDGRRLKNNFTLPTVIECKGDFALELALSKIAEIYYGVDIKNKIEELLKVRLSLEQIERNFEIYLEH